MENNQPRFNSGTERMEHFIRMCKRFGIQVDIKRLDEMGFFDAPSSINHHGNYAGGNYDHSAEVADFLISMTEKGIITWQNPRSPWVVGIFHDLCKTDYYRELLMEEGQPKRWEYNEQQVLSGHGEKSIMLLSQFLQLTEEEVLCIRYHMGAYNKNDWDAYDMAIRKYETVLWTHTADMYAAKVKNI